MTAETAITPIEYKPITAYTDEQIRVYKRQLKCLDASPDEWKMLEILSTAYKLDPFLRHIWVVPKIGVFVGHAGFIELAARSGRYAGMITHSYNSDGTEYRGGANPPAYSTCRVSFKDTDKIIAKTVYWSEFGELRKGKDGKTTNWDKMPAFMLEKVAEVHALKRAFSLSGIYAPEEFGYDEEEIMPKPDTSYTTTVNGEPVKVEPLKKAEAIDNNKCPQCGRVSLYPSERAKYEKSFDDMGLGSIPAGYCAECATKLWRIRKAQKEETGAVKC